MSYYNKFQSDAIVAPARAAVDMQEILRWVYLWMGFGLATTAVAAVVTVNTPALVALLASPVLWIALIAELILVFALSATIMRLSPAAAAVMFFVYALLNGFTLSGIFLVYTQTTISAAFMATAALYGAMTIVGFTTQIDLTRFRSYLMMGLIGLLAAMVLNIFIGGSGLSMLISVVGVLLFTALTAYDTQKIKHMAQNAEVQGDGSIAMKLSIIGALTLYLDFVNLFLFLLRLLGGRD
jgi:FtsH-binding integral membrane protein